MIYNKIERSLLKYNCVFILLLANMSCGLMFSQAATIQVDASSAANGCSLDEAISSANDNMSIGGCSSGEIGRDVITFSPSLFPVYEIDSFFVISNIPFSASATPQITSEIEIIGPDNQPTLLALELGQVMVNSTRAFAIAANGKLTLRNLALKNFPRSSSVVRTGGTIRVAGELIADNIEITGSRAFFGGAIWIQSGSAFISNSTIWDNSAANQGGGIGLSSNSSLTIFDSTISNNQAGEQGGGIALAASPNSHLSIINSTISENHSDGEGGGISLFFAATTQTKSTVNIKNSILSGNTAPASRDVHFIDSIESGEQDIRYNILGSNSTNYITSTNSLIFFTPENNNILATGLTDGIPLRSILGPLRNNGGKTQTHALIENSPAIDAAIPFTSSGALPFVFLETGCRNASTLFGVGNYRTDQRGVARPIGNECDIGAYEYEILDEACYVLKAKNGNVINFCL